jgi:DNA-binding NarL/FixJ family response regulator
VLIADQREDDRFFLKLVIRKRAPALEVIGEAANGERLMDYLSGSGPFADREQHPFPDLLIMNWRLPLKNGAEVLSWARAQDFPPLKIAVMTVPAPETDGSDAANLGADYIFSKASNLQELERILQVLVGDMNCHP